MEYQVYKNVGKNILFISTIGLSSIFIAKSIIRRRRQEQFNPTAKANEELYQNEKLHKETDYYANLAKVRPGFPLPQDDVDAITGERKERYERKSQYEGSGMSVSSRKHGDRLGFLDRRRGNNE
ncbi:similar to Saccharomyces cerevisiae YDR381C-A Protein of unknown function, localized to the mitochondrial outer membrane [Maudiozyma barnettii]|uniref:Uncharacterized protein n=1 Tax=Maudiozyma barnettii TaxID=61262 RepID=A0A8H2VDX4_9SACH|nr:Coi1p [Kazachstania barnettii]CAB4253741.1 similar to Saccharomyces cerevisiae YDR381C-A Protein of unknown function, localized to the mitochondrial outer membrane [Kazachstania barnettii]CAD1781489.1 similar to Saccharomyces cerevisiae YDR381C-A Protein of unknown function, localized to the mitochondrial outer membrane [Kazachstania barnettii]